MKNSRINTILALLLVVIVAVGAYSYHEHEKNTASLRIGDTTISVTGSGK